MKALDLLMRHTIIANFIQFSINLINNGGDDNDMIQTKKETSLSPHAFKKHFLVGNCIQSCILSAIPFQVQIRCVLL